MRDGSSTILVNRGFITTTRAEAIRHGAQRPTEGEVIVEGILNKEGSKGYFSPENKPETNEWFWKDIESMAAYVGDTQPVLVDVIDGELKWRCC